MLPSTPFWSLHTHSKYSVNDALPSVPGIVRRAEQLGYPAIGLTDHASVSGSIQLYKAARKAGIEPLPGIELYLKSDRELRVRSNMHLTVAAYSETGYRNLIRLATTAARNFWYKPVVDMADLAAMAEDNATQGLVVATGCFSGPVVQALVHHGPEEAERIVNTFAGWFPTVYVELMNHGIESFGEGDLDVSDDEVTEALWDLSHRTGIPPIITRDSHYIDPEDKEIHDGLKRMVGWGEDPDDATFSGEGYWMTDVEGLVDTYPTKMLAAGLDSLAELAEKAYVRLPEMETFKVKVPDVSVTGDPMHELEELVWELMPAWMRKKHAYVDQAKAELDVIRTGGMAPYMLLVRLVAKFMTEKQIQFIVRGSAVGSLVLRILGVHTLDPIKLRLRFDRFLSGNRMKPPDVDFDVEHKRRGEVIDFITSHWAVQVVGSMATYSIYETEDDSDKATGSLRVKFFQMLRKSGIEEPEWRNIPPGERRILHTISDLKLPSGYRKHAAGYIVAPSQADLDMLPLALIPGSRQLVTAYAKKDVEILGFTKLDLLGQKVQTAVRLMQEFTGIDFEDIPDKDAATFRAISSGRTVGVFQLDGFSMMKGCQRLKPKNIGDIIAAQALFRPAPRDAGVTGDYLARRAGRMAVPTRHPDIMEVTKDTYGGLLYQEQVMDVMSRLGMTRAELEQMLDAVKASNEYTNGARETIAELMPRIRELATARDWEPEDIAWLAEGMEAYAGYSFNLAHAAAYGYVAYRTAWMRVNHPLEFWCAMLIAHDDDDNVVKYMTEARKDGIKILPPHVNKSGITFTLDRELGAIRKGLVTVRNVGQVGAAELAANAPYTSLTDMAERCAHNKVSGLKPFLLKHLDPADAGGQLAALAAAHALEGLQR